MGISQRINSGSSSELTSRRDVFHREEPSPGLFSGIANGISNAWNYMTQGDGADAVSKLWDDVTGKNTIKLQNKLEEQRAENDYQRNLQSYSDTLQAMKDAGINPDLMQSKGSSPVQYSAPNLTAYSGADRAQFVFNRVAQMANLIPAIYNGDIARERVKQAQIQTEQAKEDLISRMNANDDSFWNRPFSWYRAMKTKWNHTPLTDVNEHHMFDMEQGWHEKLGRYYLESKFMDNDMKRLNLDSKLNDNYYRFGVSRLDTNGMLSPHRVALPSVAQENKIRQIDVDYAEQLKKWGIAGQVTKLLGTFGQTFLTPFLQGRGYYRHYKM